MSEGELVANYSGAGRVITAGYNPGTERKWPTLAAEFKNEVLFGNMASNFAWYVDYFTVRPERYGVRMLSQDPEIRITNEDKRHRDPLDPVNGKWQAEDVADWFTVQSDEWYADSNYSGPSTGRVMNMILKFTAAHGEEVKEHKLTLAPFACGFDGGVNPLVWDRYCEDGIRGALEPFLSNFVALVGIEVRRV